MENKLSLIKNPNRIWYNPNKNLWFVRTWGGKRYVFGSESDAIAFRDSTDHEALLKKINNAKSRIRELADSITPPPYPFNVAEAAKINDATSSELLRAIRKLPERERSYLRRNMELGETQRDIAKTEGIGSERVRQIVALAVCDVRARIYSARTDAEIKQARRERELLDQRRAELIQEMRETGQLDPDIDIVFGKISYIEGPERYDGVPIEEVGLSVRAVNGLKRLGVETLGALLRKSPREVAKARWIGKKTVEDIESVLHNKGLKLPGDK